MATSTSVARRSSACERRASPITRLRRDSRLGPGMPGVAGGRLPSYATVLGDAAEVTVALRGRDLGRVARHRSGTRRHDDSGIRVAGADIGGDILLVIGAVAGEGGERSLDPVG